MSAPVTRDPLVVNTQDGSCWTRRAVTRAGRGLYALAGVQGPVPELVLATLTELAEHGLASMTDTPPAPPAASAPGLLAEDRTAIAALIGDAKPAAPALLVSFAESVRDRREHDHSTQLEDWYCLNLAAFMGERMGPVLRRLVDAEARVAELLAERHTANEALDDAVQELRARREDVTPDGITQRIAPTQALRELVVDGEHYALVHHSYRTGRDLPERGRPDEWCTGCNTDHGPDECGYRPETGGTR